MAGLGEDLVQGAAREPAFQRAIGRAMAERRAFTAVLRLEPRLGESGAQAVKVLRARAWHHAARRDAVLSTRRRQSSDSGQETQEACTEVQNFWPRRFRCQCSS